MKTAFAAALVAGLMAVTPSAQANEGVAFGLGFGLGLFGGLAVHGPVTYQPYGPRGGYQAPYYVEHPGAVGYVYRPYQPYRSAPSRRVITTPHGYGVPGYVAHPRAIYRAASSRHQWCAERYRSYDPVSGTFVDKRGRIRQCL